MSKNNPPGAANLTDAASPKGAANPADAANPTGAANPAGAANLTDTPTIDRTNTMTAITQPNSTRYHHRLALLWIANIMKRVNRRSSEAEELVDWLRENALDLCIGLNGKKGAADAKALVKATAGMPESPIRRRGRRKLQRMVFDSEFLDEFMDLDEDEGAATDSRRAWRRLKKHIEQLSRNAGGIAPDATALRLQELATIVDLAPEDVRLLEFVLLYRTQPFLESLVDSISLSRHGRVLSAKNDSMPRFLGMTPDAIRRRLSDDAPLVASGLLAVDSDGDLSMATRIERLTWQADTESDVRRLLLAASPPTELDSSDFEYLAQDRDIAASILAAALKNGKKGVNILLYGPNGTGKTELAKVLAQKIVGATLFAVGEKDECGGEPTRGERLADLRLAGSLLGKDPNAILLFDEMDDLFSGDSMVGVLFGLMSGRMPGHGRGGGSKLFMNRLLETNAAPTIWITNHGRAIDPAFMRRMTYVVELRKPPVQVREGILTRQFEKSNAGLGQEAASELARRFDMPPGVADTAIPAAALLPEDKRQAMLERSFENIAALMGFEKLSQAPPELFDPKLVQADHDLVYLAEKLTERGPQPFSICLQGPPGTGKSAYVRYLAERMGLEVLHKRASDLLSSWVGNTEKKIRRAFQEARDTRSFLVFDEADSLLFDRHLAQRGWEVSQVNELLTQLETHTHPVACTTNFMEKIDVATYRRFMFKVALGYSTADQAADLFRLYFDMEEPDSLAALTALTPGDFPVVRKRAEILGHLDDAETLVAMLKAECDAKPNRSSGMGFSPIA